MAISRTRTLRRRSGDTVFNTDKNKGIFPSGSNTRNKVTTAENTFMSCTIHKRNLEIARPLTRDSNALKCLFSSSAHPVYLVEASVQEK
jgi:hypothetical protein